VAFTYFFRDLQTLEMIRDLVLPSLCTRRYINIWDAGCAMGQEPYTLAIILRENMGAMLFRNVRIHATDIDGSNLFGEIIANATYPADEVKRVPDGIRERYFTEIGDGSRVQVIEEIRRSVRFSRHDLLTLTPAMTGANLIVCKNVLLHFHEQERIQVIRMYHAALEQDGVLVMEQTQKMPPEVADLFESVAPNAQVYRKR
jgi:chemotaxis protein methyltransferase CheR